VLVVPPFLNSANDRPCTEPGQIKIRGDFFFYLTADLSSLEDALTDVAADEASITKDVWLTGCSTIIERFELCPQAACALW